MRFNYLGTVSSSRCSRFVQVHLFTIAPQCGQMRSCKDGVPVRTYLFVTLLAVLFSVTIASAAGAAELVPTAPKKQVPSIMKKPEQPKMTIPNLVNYTTGLSEKLIDLQSQLIKIGSPDKDLDRLARMEKSLESLNWETRMQQADTNLSYKRLSSTLQLLIQQQNDLNTMAEPLHEAVRLLDEQKEYWTREQATLQSWVEALKDNKTFSLFQDNVTKLQESITSALKDIDERMAATLTTLHKTSDLQVKLYNLKVTADDLLSELRKGGLEQTSPSMVSSQFYSRLHVALLRTTWQNMMTELTATYRIAIDNGRELLLILAFPALLSIIIIINRDKLKKHKNWAMMTDCPVAFSFFTVLIIVVPFMEMAATRMFPLMSIGLILSVMMLAGKLEKQSIWVVRFIVFFTFFLVLNILVELVKIPLPLMRIYVMVASSCWLAYFIWRISRLRGKEHRYIRWALLVTCLSLTVIAIAAFSGYDEFAQYLFKGIFLTIFLFICSIILFHVIRILLELLLTMLPVIRRHADVIITALQPFIFILCALLFYSTVASVWLLFSTTQDAITALADFGFPLGGYTLTMQTVLVAVSVIYGAILISRAIQAILLDEIMPRKNIDKGVQLSIARLVHYAILLIGFLILLQIMGVSLTKLTILGGALGVGIGFGLQAIVNNFASGLILLFERPIKVGDTIELETDMGVVKKLGLRSTIIQTFDNAEIVVPNSELVTTQVTNWTLAERKARVKIPIGVAYGSDISQVLEILLTVGKEHPMTLTTPPPTALFLSFGASSLDFELRVWIIDFNDRRQVQSELNQEINSEFADAGIEIPFPQTDLHLRTVDSEAAETLYAHGVAADV